MNSLVSLDQKRQSCSGRNSFLLLSSWGLVAFGQPHLSPLLALSAAVVGFALFWLVLFGLASKAKRFWLSASWFTAVQLVQLNWLASPTYQGYYIVAVYLGLAVGLGLQFGGLALLFPRSAPMCWQRILLIVGVWVLCEWSRLFFLCGFVWNPVGLALTATLWTAQPAAIGGVFGLSFWVVLVNLLVVNSFFSRKKSNLVLAMMCFLLPCLAGALHVNYHHWRRLGTSGEKLRVALVQPGLSPDQKNLWLEQKERFVSPFKQWARVLGDLEEKKCAGELFDLIVLPEAAFPFTAYACVYPYADVARVLHAIWGDAAAEVKMLLGSPLGKQERSKWFVSNAFWAQALANHYSAEVVVGLVDREGDTGRCYNAAFHFKPYTLAIERYDKQILLPLAEYVPFAFLRPLIARYGIEDSFAFGKETKIVGQQLPISISICYEECFGDRMRSGKQKGAKLFVNVTNDGWYPASQLPKQHFTHSYLRSIENGIPVVRACNTGVTVAMDSSGRIVNMFCDKQGEVEQVRGVLVTSVDLYAYSTLYTFWGDGFIVILSLICVAIGSLHRQRVISRVFRKFI